MSFFSDMHRSIFDPEFCRETVKRPRGRIALFLVKMLVFTAFIMCMSKTYYLLHPKRGAAPLVGAMFGDVQISGGRLVTAREVPFGVAGDMLTDLMNRLAGSQRFFARAPDDFLMVDTRALTTGDQTPPAAKIVFREAGVEFREMHTFIPYKIFTGDGDFQFTVAAVQEALNRNAVSFALGFFVTSLFFVFFTMFMSVFFLSLAAYLFRADREKGYKLFLRLACYCVTPVALGDAIVSVSGVSAEWMWHVFIVVSTILMFRSITRLSADRGPADAR